jgi:excisionase family DNA binding protein
MLQPAADSVLSIAEAARRLQASESTVLHWVASGRLPCAHRFDSHRQVIECVILETDFLAFAQRRAALYGMPLERPGRVSLPASRPGITSLAAAAFTEAAESPHAQESWVPGSWRWANTGLRLVWITSGLLVLAAAGTLAGWWAR